MQLVAYQKKKLPELMQSTKRMTVQSYYNYLCTWNFHFAKYNITSITYIVSMSRFRTLKVFLYISSFLVS